MTGVLTDSSWGEETEVVAKATRRRFTAAYKRRVLQEADRCEQPGAIGTLLRREGLYSSHLTAWRAARARGELAGAGPGGKGRGVGGGPKKTLGPLAPGRRAEHRAALMQTITELAPRHGVRATCVALAVAPASYYRCRRPRAAARPRSSPRALTSAEQQAVLGVLHGERFVDVAPEEVVATLLDEERYLCSARTMYRLLAARLIAATCERQGITPGQLTLHADRGSSMRAKTVALLLADLGVTKTHSRPYTSMDNPYSEALFKTAKYRPAIPERFGSLEHARQIFGPLFAWYNTAHRHSGLALLTPQDVHHGVAQQRLAARAAVLAAAYAAHPERFPRGLPTPGTLPTAVWINKPATPADTATTALPASARIDALEAGRG